MEKTKDTCGGCEYFFQPRPMAGEGQCRFDPPKLFEVPDASALRCNPPSVFVTMWPTVESYYKACSKFVPGETS